MEKSDRSWLFLALAAIGLSLLMLVPLACGGAAQSVGLSCRDHADCPGEARCLRGNRYPGGTCTIACDDHYDCPGFAYCIDREGGVCLEGCDRDRDCRSSYECSNERNNGSGGRSYVCIGD